MRNINKIFKQLLILTILVIILLLPYFVFAQETIKDILTDLGGHAGFDRDTTETTMASTVGTIVSAIISLLGIVFIGLMLYGGFNWMTATGEEEKINKAKETIRRALVGLIITVSAFAIWAFIYSSFINPTS